MVQIKAWQDLKYRVPGLPIGRSLTGQPEKMAVYFGESVAESWENLSPDPGTEVARVGIGRIGPATQSLRRQVLLDLCSSEPQQGPDYGSGEWGHTGQAGRSRTCQHPHQNGLHLVIGMVPGEDHVPAQSYPGGFQPGIPSSPGLGLSRRWTQVQPSHLAREIVR
jgi:hypothetical protein